MRLWPTCIVAAFVFCLVGRNGSVLFALSGSGWFVSCILLHYAVYYPIQRYMPRCKIVVVGLVAIALALLAIAGCQPHGRGVTLFSGNYYVWICYFEFFLMGGLVAERKAGMRKGLALDGTLSCACLIGFYAYILLAKRIEVLGCCQLLVLLPLYGFVHYLYQLFQHPRFEVVNANRVCNFIVRAVGGLSLEMYLCGSIATQVIPAQWPVVSYVLGLLIALGFAYVVKCASRFFAQTISHDSGYDYRAIFAI